MAVVTPKSLLDGVFLAGSDTTIYTASTTVVVRTITLCNTDATLRLVTLHIVQVGGAVGAAKRILDVVPMASKESLVIPGGSDPGGPLFILETGDFISAKADSAGVVSIRMDGAEIS